MQGLLKVSRAIDALNQRIGGIADWLIFLSVLIAAGNATMRYLLDYSTNGLLEVQWYLFGGAVFLGASYTLKLNEHVRVDIVYSPLPERARLIVDAVGLLVFLIPAMAFFAWLSWPVFARAFESGEMSSNYGGLPQWPILLMLPLGFALLSLQGLSELIKRIAALRHEAYVDTHYEKPLQ